MYKVPNTDNKQSIKERLQDLRPVNWGYDCHKQNIGRDLFEATLLIWRHLGERLFFP